MTDPQEIAGGLSVAGRRQKQEIRLPLSKKSRLLCGAVSTTTTFEGDRRPYASRNRFRTTLVGRKVVNVGRRR